MVGLKDIANEAGVSLSMVSRTFTEGCSVSHANRKKILAVAKKLGYARIPADAPAIEAKRIVLQLDNETVNFYPEIWELLHQIGVQHAVEWLVAPKAESAALQGLLRVGGSPSADKPEYTQTLPDVHCFPSQFPERGAAVGVDFARNGAQAAQIMLAAGHQSFAFLGAGLEHQQTRQCLAGFSSVLDHAVQLEWREYHTKENSIESAHNEIIRHIKTGKLAPAYFCSTEQLGLGTVLALRERGMTVPKNCALLTVGDTHHRCFGMALSTLQIPFEDMLQSATTHLCALIENPRISKEQRVLPCRLIDRGSLSI